MKNSVLIAKQQEDKNSCTLADIELCEKGIQSIWTVDDNGDADYLQTTYSNEAYYAYYYCQSCEGDWAMTPLNREETWAKVKEHLNG